MRNEFRAAVITVSDRSAAGEREDASGPEMVAVLTGAGIAIAHRQVVADAVPQIRAAVTQAIHAGATLVLLTGGTGISERDVTGAALTGILDERIPGIEEELRRLGIAAGAPGALLSRPVAGLIRSARALCIAGPGSRGGARDTASLAVGIAPHALAQLRGDTNAGHTNVPESPATSAHEPQTSTGTAV